ncbi:hypothetical protein BCR12_12050 [Limnothrix sp. P13C2]|nr:hypothetical protein BCR12_12050 [Limnothrix sp. P13C2]
MSREMLTIRINLVENSLPKFSHRFMGLLMFIYMPMHMTDLQCFKFTTFVLWIHDHKSIKSNKKIVFLIK